MGNDPFEDPGGSGVAADRSECLFPRPMLKCTVSFATALRAPLMLLGFMRGMACLVSALLTGKMCRMGNDAFEICCVDTLNA